MKLYESASRGVLEKWAFGFAPSGVLLCDLASGEEIRETSLAAARVRPAESFPGEALEIRAYLAAGEAALAWEGAADTAVFSPLRRGLAADYEGTVYLFRAFLRRLRPGLRLPKPVVCIRMQERATEVERIALVDAGLQAGAGKVLLYREPLALLREYASQRKELRRALAIHIETCEERE